MANRWKIGTTAVIFSLSGLAFVGLSERESEWKWAAVAVFLASLPLILRIDKSMSKGPPDPP